MGTFQPRQQLKEQSAPVHWNSFNMEIRLISMGAIPLEK
jgi:hypothetical protein